MSRDKQIEEKVIAKNCVNCIHNLICEKLEEFRDPLHWVNTEGEFVCSYYDTVYYDKASDVAEEIFAEIEKAAIIGEITGKVTIVASDYAELKKKYIGKDTNVTTNTEEGK